MFINASCVIGLGLEVEASGKVIVWENSSLESRGESWSNVSRL